MAQNKPAQARKVFEGALTFVQGQEESSFGHAWNAETAQVAEQVALVNLAAFERSQGNPDKALRLCVAALCRPQEYGTAATIKALREAEAALPPQRAAEKDAIQGLLSQFGFQGTGGPPRSVLFALDYSGSMAGSRINSAVDALLDIFDANIRNGDEVALITFSDSVSIGVELQKVRPANRAEIRDRVDRLRRPSGRTALFDALGRAAQILARSSNRKYLVVLSDGADNGSSMPFEALRESLRGRDLALIAVMVACGPNEEGILRELVGVNDSGAAISSGASATEIKEAFGKVAELLQGEVVLEDF
jgi:Mg-chelatase subunit ChlD